MSPCFSVPDCTSTVATAPRPLSRLDSMTMPLALPVVDRLQLQHLGLQQDRLEQVVDAFAGDRRDVDEDVVAAPVLGDDLVLRQLVLDPVGIGVLPCRSC